MVHLTFKLNFPDATSQLLFKMYMVNIKLELSQLSYDTYINKTLQAEASCETKPLIFISVETV